MVNSGAERSHDQRALEQSWRLAAHRGSGFVELEEQRRRQPDTRVGEKGKPGERRDDGEGFSRKSSKKLAARA